MYQPTTDIVFIESFLRYLEKKYSVDINEFLQQLSLDRDSLEMGEGVASHVTYTMLIGEASKYIGKPNLGLHYMAELDFRELGLFGYALLNSKTIGDGVKMANRYYSLFQSGSRNKLKVHGNKVHWSYQLLDHTMPYHRLDVELEMMGMITMIRQQMGNTWQPDEVYFQYPAPLDISEYEELFCSSLCFNHSINQVVFDKDLLDVPIRGSDHILGMVLEKTLEQRLKLRRLAAEQEWLGLLYERVADTFADGVPTLEMIASKLNMSARTLQRRLADYDVTFKEILEHTRSQLAMNYLKASDLSIEDITIQLGYSEPSVFQRAFKRWTGDSPLKYRQRHQIQD